MSETTAVPQQVCLRGGALVDRATFSAFMAARSRLLKPPPEHQIPGASTALRALWSYYRGATPIEVAQRMILSESGIVEFDAQDQAVLPAEVRQILKSFGSADSLCNCRFTPLIPGTHVQSPEAARRWPSFKTALRAPQAGYLRLVFVALCVGTAVTVLVAMRASLTVTALVAASCLLGTTLLALACLARMAQDQYAGRFDRRVP